MKIEKVRMFKNTEMETLKDCDDFMVYGFVQFNEDGCPIICTNLLVDDREMASDLLNELESDALIMPLRVYYRPYGEENEQA